MNSLDSFWLQEIQAQLTLSWNSLMNSLDSFWLQEISYQSTLSWNFSTGIE